MQKLEERDTYTPTDAPQVCSNCDSELNRNQSFGVQSLKTSSNNLDVDRSQRKGSSDLRVQNVVYVLNMRGIPLMPTSQKKANKLLKEKKAKVVKRKPFTIQMLVPTGETRQVVVLGIDSGYKHIGFSATTKKKELISGEVELDMKTKERLETKRMYRRLKRNKLWYRKPRFMNRVSTKKKGWLPPSIQRRYGIKK